MAAGLIVAADRLLKKPMLPPGGAPAGLEQNESTPGNVPGESAAEPVGEMRRVSQIPPYIGRPLNEVRFGAGFSAPESAVEKKRGDLKILAAVLSAKPRGEGGVDDWIAVGVIKKFFNDYEGARDVWEYAGVLYPTNALSFANLGNLYGFYLHDNAKAEFNLKKAIASDPYQPGYYLSLADFYKTVYVSKKSEAPKVLLEGMNVVKDVNLMLALATYYRDESDKANAVKYYEEVLKMSPEQAGVREEIERLR